MSFRTQSPAFRANGGEESAVASVLRGTGLPSRGSFPADGGEESAVASALRGTGLPSCSIPSFDEALEEYNRLQDYARVETQRLRYTHKASRLLILDAYLRGEFSLLLYMQALGKINAVGRSLKIPRSATGPNLACFVLHLDSTNVACRQNRNKKPVLISVVEIVNGPNGVIPSLARLYRVEHEPKEGRADSVYMSMRQKTFHFFDGLADGEFRPVINKRGSTLLDGFQPSIVESAFKVMDSITNHESEVIEGIDIAKSVCESLSSILRVNLNSTGISFIKRDDARFDVQDVFIGPINFQSSVSKMGSHKRKAYQGDVLDAKGYLPRGNMEN